MKKIASLLLTVIFVICLASCDALPAYLRSDNSPSGSSDTSGSSGGYEDGRIGDTMYTEWFSFCVDGVEAASEYKGYAADAGYFLIIADITVKNTYGYDLPMSQYDFQVQWGEDYEAYGYGIDESEMPIEYTLKRGQSVSQKVVYEIPYDNDGEFSISYWEYFESGEYGTVFFIYFEQDVLDFSGFEDSGTRQISLL